MGWRQRHGHPLGASATSEPRARPLLGWPPRQGVRWRRRDPRRRTTWTPAGVHPLPRPDAVGRHREYDANTTTSGSLRENPGSTISTPMRCPRLDDSPSRTDTLHNRHSHPHRTAWRIRADTEYPTVLTWAGVGLTPRRWTSPPRPDEVGAGVHDPRRHPADAEHPFRFELRVTFDRRRRSRRDRAGARLLARGELCRCRDPAHRARPSDGVKQLNVNIAEPRRPPARRCVTHGH